MSIQSDVEMLSVQAVEYYAQKHHLSEGEVFDLFCKHQVFEKILIQHEMLHQLDMSETFHYVEEIIKKEVPELVLYHGSNIIFDKIDLEKSIITVTLAGDFTAPYWRTKRQNGLSVYIFVPIKAADMFTAIYSTRQIT